MRGRRKRKLNELEISEFFGQIAVMTQAGIPLPDALDALMAMKTEGSNRHTKSFTDRSIRGYPSVMLWRKWEYFRILQYRCVVPVNSEESFRRQ